MSEQLLTLLSCLDWSMYWGYIYNVFIVNLFLIWSFTLFDICLRSPKLDVSSWEFVWKGWGAVHVRKGFFDMLKKQMWQNSYYKEFLLFATYCIYAVFLDLILQYFNILVPKRYFTAQKMKFFIKDFFRKCVQIRSFLRIWSYLLKKSWMQNFNFCAVFVSCDYCFLFVCLSDSHGI